MGYRKTHDLAVAVGRYTDRDGKERNRYENVGHVLTGDDGGKLYCVKRTFAPAGVPNPEGRDTVVLAVFEVREPGQQRDTAPASRPMESYPSTPARPVREPVTTEDFDDSVPF